MGKTTALRREIKSRFIPYVEQQGFMLDEAEAPTFWIFRRAAGRTAHLFSIQWEKYGRPRFRLDFGSCPLEGLTLGDKHFEWPSIHPHWTPDIATLKPCTGPMSGTWFRQDRGLLRRLVGAGTPRSPSEVVDGLMAAFPHVQSCWEGGTASRHIQRWPSR